MDLYQFQRPEAAAPVGAIVNPSHVEGMHTKANADSTQIEVKCLSIDINFMISNKFFASIPNTTVSIVRNTNEFDWYL